MKESIKNNSLKKALLMFSNWGFSWKGFIDNKSGEWWLIIQVVILLLLITIPAWSPLHANILLSSIVQEVIGIPLLFLGIIRSIGSFVNLGASLSPLPEPKKNATLITHGLYQRCRHPLYQSLLLSSLGITIVHGSISHLILTLLLSLVLVSKAKREEMKLKLIHTKYNEYLLNVPAICSYIPFLDWRK